MPSTNGRAARVLVSLLALAMLAGLTTAATLVHRREAALAPMPSSPWRSVHTIGGPRLWGALGQFEVESPVASVRVTSDPVPGPSPAGFADALRAEAAHLYDCYRHQLEDDPTLELHVAATATLWPSGALTEVAAVAEPARGEIVRACVVARLSGFSSGWSSRTTTLPIAIHLDFSPRASRGP